jgi:hypothetical protein
LRVPRKVRYGSYFLMSGCSVSQIVSADHGVAVRAGEEDADVRKSSQDVRDSIDQVVGALLVRKAGRKADHLLPRVPPDTLAQRGPPLGRRIWDKNRWEDDAHFAGGLGDSTTR